MFFLCINFLNSSSVISRSVAISDGVKTLFSICLMAFVSLV